MREATRRAPSISSLQPPGTRFISQFCIFFALQKTRAARRCRAARHVPVLLFHSVVNSLLVPSSLPPQIPWATTQTLSASRLVPPPFAPPPPSPRPLPHQPAPPPPPPHPLC